MSGAGVPTFGVPFLHCGIDDLGGELSSTTDGLAEGEHILGITKGSDLS
jgi:hypothetical protein